MTARHATLPLFAEKSTWTPTLSAYPRFTATDLFCGAGGTTTGFENAMFRAHKVVTTRQVVNHDPVAIASHEANHAAARHFIEDITKLDASLLVRTSILWASLECTNFSNAKGGQSRDADSRSLAEHMERYIRAVNPLYFFVENVREFMSWGPLYHKRDKAGKLCYRRVKVMEPRLYAKTGLPMVSSKTGKPLMRQAVTKAGKLRWEKEPVMLPVSRTKGRDFIRWKQSIEDLGYTSHYKLLNAADYGERTSRVRLFMVFAKEGLPVRWPRATHSKDGKTVGTLPWLPVRPCLRLHIKGRSIFNRTKTNKHGKVVLDDLVEKTLKRIFAGLCKYVAGSTVLTITERLTSLAAYETQAVAQEQAAWLLKRSSNPPSGEANPGASLDEPAPTVATCFHPDLVQADFLAKAYTGNAEHLVQGTDAPAGTITTVDHHQLVQVEAQGEFLTNPGWQGNHSNTGADEPSHTIVARQDKVPLQLIQPEFLMQSNGGPDASKVTPTSGPSRTVLASPNQSLVQPEFLTMRHNENLESRGRSLDQPAAAITTKDHHTLIQTEFLTQYNGGSDDSRNLTLEGPANTITTENRFGLLQTEPVENEFIQKYYGSGDNVTGSQEPAGTLTTKDRMALVQAETAFLDKRYGSGNHNHQSLDAPAGAITTNDHHAVVQTEWLDRRFGSGDHNHLPVTSVAGTITTIDNHGLAQVVPADAYLLNTSFDNTASTIDEPAPTLTASRHHPYLAQPEPWLLDNKFNNVGRELGEPGPTLLTGDHHYLATPEAGLVPQHWVEQADDSETLRLIRRFMRAYGLADILLRMLLVEELLQIQGFPADYVLMGSITDQKKFIGNSVPPKMSQRITEAIYEVLEETGKLHLLTEYEGGDEMQA